MGVHTEVAPASESCTCLVIFLTYLPYTIDITAIGGTIPNAITANFGDT